MAETKTQSALGMRQAFTVVERNGKSFWVRIGAVFTNRDSSETVLLDALPVNGKILIRQIENNRRQESAPDGE